MGIIKEHIIFEKFIEDSDPIHDMGIGIFAHREFESTDEFYNFLVKIIKHILKVNEIPEVFIMTTAGFHSSCMKTHYHDKLQDYLDTYVTINDGRESHRIVMLEFAKRMKEGIRISTPEEID